MIGRVWLVRHAATEWTGHRWCGRTDLPLSPEGTEEARAVAERLRHVLPEAARVITSPAARARSTAEQIAEARWTGAATRRPEVVEDLHEVDFGAVDGRTWAQVERDLPELAQDILAGRRIDWPDGETAAAVEARVELLRRLVAATSTPVVLVGHAAILGALAGALTRSAVLGRVALAPATALELVREGRTWHPVNGRT